MGSPDRQRRHSERQGELRRRGAVLRPGDCRALAGHLATLLDDPGTRTALVSGVGQIGTLDWTSATRTLLEALDLTDARALNEGSFLVAGARPNFMKVAPVLLALRATWPRATSSSTRASTTTPRCRTCSSSSSGLPQPEHLARGRHGTACRADRAGDARTSSRSSPTRGPSAVVVVGDVNSTLAAALVAAKLGIPVAHVEAGLRSFDRTMPEEINRIVTDAVADLLFAPSSDGVDNLRREGVAAERIFLVGNVMIDSLERMLPDDPAELPEHPGAGASARRRTCVVTLHRPSNVDDDAALDRVMRRSGGGGPRPGAARRPSPNRPPLCETGLRPTRAATSRSSPRCGYVEFLSLMRHCGRRRSPTPAASRRRPRSSASPASRCARTPSGPITVTEGPTSWSAPTATASSTPSTGCSAANGSRDGVPTLWDGHAGERIADVLIERYGCNQPW